MPCCCLLGGEGQCEMFYHCIYEMKALKTNCTLQERNLWNLKHLNVTLESQDT